MIIREQNISGIITESLCTGSAFDFVAVPPEKHKIDSWRESIVVVSRMSPVLKLLASYGDKDHVQLIPGGKFNFSDTAFGGEIHDNFFIRPYPLMIIQGSEIYQLVSRTTSPILITNNGDLAASLPNNFSVHEVYDGNGVNGLNYGRLVAPQCSCRVRIKVAGLTNVTGVPVEVSITPYENAGLSGLVPKITGTVSAGNVQQYDFDIDEGEIFDVLLYHSTPSFTGRTQISYYFYPL